MEILQDPLFLLVLTIGTLIVLRIVTSLDCEKKYPHAGLSYRALESEKLKTIIWNQEEFLAFVTAGVGPEKVGEHACELAEKTIFELFLEKESAESPLDFLKRSCIESHKRISENLNTQKGGCSIAIIYIKNKQLYWTSSGNISIYLYHEKLTRLNRRDLYKYYLRDRIMAQQISEKRVVSNQLKNELTSYLGFENFKKIEQSQTPIELAKKDQIFLCTQAFDLLFSQIEIEGILSERQSVEKRILGFQDKMSHSKTNEKIKILLIEGFNKLFL